MKKHLFKKMLAITCSFILVFSMFSVAGSAETAGPMPIGTPDDLTAFAETVKADPNAWAGKTAVLTADIDMTGVQWTPIANFAGTFDGQGFSIQNLTYLSDLSKTGGLFAKITDATVKNLCIIGGEVTGIANIGGIAGEADGKCVFDTVYTTATVKTTDSSNAGGILGTVPKAGVEVKLMNCVANGNVVSVSNGAGGLVGYVEKDSNLTLTDCAFLGVCTGNNYSGGMVGYSRGNLTFERCASLGTVKCANVQAGFAAVYSDRAKTWNLADAARKEDPNADISAYVNKVTFIDCYYSQTHAVYRHSNRYFACFEFSVIYTDGSVEAELPSQYNGFAMSNPDFAQINNDYAKAFKKIDPANFDFASYGLLKNWVAVDGALYPAKAAQMLGKCPLGDNLYYQKAVTPNANGTVNVRFLILVDDLRYQNVGFDLKLIRTDVQGKVQTSKAITRTVTQVYQSVIANGETVTAESLGGKYLVSVVVTNINVKDYQNTFAVDSFVTMEDGTVLKTAEQTYSMERETV